jgi:hypothetical protein
MIRFTALAISALLAVASLPFCKKDPVNCKDEKVGDVYFSAESKAWFPEMVGTTIIFENAQGQSKTYQLTKNESRVPLNVEKLCESFNLSTHFRYMLGDHKQYVLRTASDSIIIQLSMISCALKGKKDTCFYDHLSVLRLEQNAGVECSRIISFRGHATSEIPQTDLDAQIGRFVGDTTLLGKPFTNVWAGRLIGGSPTTSPQQIYLAQGKGVVGFVDDSGALWLKNE